MLNVGAGAGSYEPDDRYVLAVEQSATMRAQRPAVAVPAVDAAAGQLPFDDDSFEAAMAVLTVHQWTDVDRGLRELRRVSRGPVVVLTPRCPGAAGVLAGRLRPRGRRRRTVTFPALAQVTAALAPGSAEVSVDSVPVPWDCTDGFGEAFYGRPEAFLRPTSVPPPPVWF